MRGSAAALETPLRLIESTGGTADWNFARFQLFLNGREIERNEIGSDAIRAGGFGRVGANSNRVVTAALPHQLRRLRPHRHHARFRGPEGRAAVHGPGRVLDLHGRDALVHADARAAARRTPGRAD
jgi:hypothetical protein